MVMVYLLLCGEKVKVQPQMFEVGAHKYMYSISSHPSGFANTRFIFILHWTDAFQVF